MWITCISRDSRGFTWHTWINVNVIPVFHELRDFQWFHVFYVILRISRISRDSRELTWFMSISRIHVSHVFHVNPVKHESNMIHVVHMVFNVIHVFHVNRREVRDQVREREMHVFHMETQWNTWHSWFTWHHVTSRLSRISCDSRDSRISRISCISRRVPVDSRPFTSIHVDSRRFTSIHVDSRRFTSIHVDSRRFTSIHVDSRRFTSIHVKFTYMIHVDYTSIHVDSRRFHVDSTWNWGESTWNRRGIRLFTWFTYFTWIDVNWGESTRIDVNRREIRDSRDSRETHETCEICEICEICDLLNSRDSLDSREFIEIREMRDSRISRDSREWRISRIWRAAHESRDSHSFTSIQVDSRGFTRISTWNTWITWIDVNHVKFVNHVNHVFHVNHVIRVHSRDWRRFTSIYVDSRRFTSIHVDSRISCDSRHPIDSRISHTSCDSLEIRWFVWFTWNTWNTYFTSTYVIDVIHVKNVLHIFHVIHVFHICHVIHVFRAKYVQHANLHILHVIHVIQVGSRDSRRFTSIHVDSREWSQSREIRESNEIRESRISRISLDSRGSSHFGSSFGTRLRVLSQWMVSTSCWAGFDGVELVLSQLDWWRMARMDRCAGLLVQYVRCRNGSNFWKLRRMAPNARMTTCMTCIRHGVTTSVCLDRRQHRSWRRQSRSRSCILLGKSSIFQKTSLSKAQNFLRVWTSSRPRQRSLWKQFFMRLSRIYPVLTLRRYATWHVWVESAFGDASGTVVQLLQRRQNSERSWRRLSKCLCYEEDFDEMKRTCAYCGMFEDEDDILVRCQVPDCSLRSADYELPGVFHGRCAVALGHSGGAQWQNCPWCPPAMLTTATVLGEFIDNFDKPQEISAVTDEKQQVWWIRTRYAGLGERWVQHGAIAGGGRPDNPEGMEMDAQKDWASSCWRGKVASEVTWSPLQSCSTLTTGSQWQENGRPQGDSIHSEGCWERVENAL